MHMYSGCYCYCYCYCYNTSCALLLVCGILASPGWGFTVARVLDEDVRETLKQEEEYCDPILYTDSKRLVDSLMYVTFLAVEVPKMSGTL